VKRITQQKLHVAAWDVKIFMAGVFASELHNAFDLPARWH
jgi:hypothetical protein